MIDGINTDSVSPDVLAKINQIPNIAASLAADLKENGIPEPKPTKDSLVYWFPKLAAGLSSYLPKTQIISYNHFDFVDFLDGQGTAESRAEYIKTLDTLQEDIWKAAREIMPFSQGEFAKSVFLRTDLASAKHDGPDAYRIYGRSDIRRKLFATVTDNEMKFGIFGPTPTALVVRQFLMLQHTFTAFKGLPVAKEFRFFSSADAVKCIHFYWPEDTIKNPSSSSWKKDLRKLSGDISFQDVNMLKELSMMAAKLAGETETGKVWSIDFACDIEGIWWLIDMADANSSFHSETCPNAKRRF